MIKELEKRMLSLGISINEIMTNLGVKDTEEYNRKVNSNSFNVEEIQKCFEMISAKEAMVELRDFDPIDYIEKIREEKKLQRKSLSNCLGITEASYANRLTRKTFSISDILKMCAFLEIDLNKLRDRLAIKSEDLSEILDYISYRGINNYSSNALGMRKIEELLKNDIILNEISPQLLFKYGFFSLDSSPNHNGYGIREADNFFNNIIYKKEKINLDFLAGVVFATMFSGIDSKELCVYPKVKLYNILNYLIQTYSEAELVYVLEKIDKNINVKTKLRLFIPQESIIHFYGEEEIPSSDVKRFETLLSYLLDLGNNNLNAEVAYLLKTIVLKLQYSYNANHPKKIALI
ncbi:MAG: helix-turn-helix domain-containing protein [Zhenhengia sp.]|uniref:helix-turn-helix domain-containing protein n=1 Tax=Zhenhengia sp. TaxID=2944208 RepID=UPI0039934E8C